MNKEIIKVENERKETKIKIEISFFVLLFLFVQVIISDFIIYFSGMKYAIAQLISLFLNSAICFTLIKKEKIGIVNNFEKWDLVFWVVFILVTALTIIFPDEYYDSYSYHIYLQKNVFEDKIYDDFFPGRTLTTYTYALADRVYTLFSNKLGFRLGVIPSYFVLIVIFYQIKKYLTVILKNKNINRKVISVLSILPMCAYIILEQAGTYYVDNMCIALLLEFFYISLFEYQNTFKNKSKLYFLALLSGILVSVKFTNAFYMIVPLIYVLVKNIKDLKNIKWHDYFLLIVVAFLPMSVYMLDAIRDTGSPVFPYYNSIFKSKFFKEYNWFDGAYGINGILEVLFWPIVLFIHPTRGYVIHEIDYNFLFGYIVSIAYISYLVIKKLIRLKKKDKENLLYDRNNLVMSLLVLYSNFVLAQFCIGYVRYGSVVPVLSGILIIKYIIDCIERKQLFRTIILSYAICASAVLGINNYFDTGKMSYYKGMFNNTQFVKERVLINASCVFKDQDYLKYDIDGIWGVIGDDSAVPSMLNIDDKIVQLRHGTMTGDTEESNRIYWDNIQNNDIYIPIFEMKEDLKLRQLDEYHFQMTEIVDCLPNVLYMLDARPVYIIKVKYNPDMNESNNQIYNKLMEEFQTKIIK